MMEARRDVQVPHQRFECCGVRIDALGLEAAAAEIAAGLAGGDVHLCNAYTLSLAARDAAYAARLNSSARNLADGMPLVWIARRLGITALRDRAYGPALMATVVDAGRQAGIGHYLYGTTDAVLDRLVARIAVRWPGASVVGAAAPGMHADVAAFDADLDAILGSGAAVVWVALGTPKQDDVAARFAALAAARGRAEVSFVAIGAAFEFLAGTKRQAPRWMQRAGLEWLFRLLAEPRRLWRRYLVGNVRFAIAARRSALLS